MSSRMKENEVSKIFANYLEKKDVLVFPQFRLPRGRKIDFLSFSWKNEYEVEINGYECKGTISARSAAKVLREQIGDYQKAVPRMYLAANTKQRSEIKTLCSLNGVGYLNITRDKKPEELPASYERQTMLDDAYYKPLRTIGAMILSFREVYKDMLGDEKPREGAYWCATPEPNDKAQHNTGYILGTQKVISTLNIENSRNLLNRIDLQELSEKILSLPEGYWLMGGITYYPVPLSPLFHTLLNIDASKVTTKDLVFLKEKSSNLVIHINIGKTIWTHHDFSPKRIHIQEMSKAREELSKLYQFLSQPIKKRHKGNSR